MRKGQGAMEYLMTYGWAILIVIIVGIVLWQSGVFGTTTGGISGFSGGIAVSDYSATSGSLSVYLQNVAGEPLRNINVSLVTIDGTASTASEVVTNLGVGSDATVTLSDSNICPTGATAFTAELNITYTTTVSGLTKVETGKISGQCS